MSMAHEYDKCFKFVPSQIAFGFLYRVFVLFACSSSCCDSLLTLESSSNHSCSDTPELLVLLQTSAIASCRSWSLCTWSLLHMRITTCNTSTNYIYLCTKNCAISLDIWAQCSHKLYYDLSVRYFYAH